MEHNLVSVFYVLYNFLGTLHKSSYLPRTYFVGIIVILFDLWENVSEGTLSFHLLKDT